MHLRLNEESNLRLRNMLFLRIYRAFNSKAR